MDHEETDRVNEENLTPARRSPENTSTVDQPLVNTKYLKHYKSHVSQFREHLRGADDINGSLTPSVVSLGAFWTREEKNLFFHALSVHSRHRPELIAAEIPGKSIVDICAYLEALSIASLADKRQLSRQVFPPAIEVSDKWIHFEDEQAEAMALHEATWDQEYRDERRDMALRDEKEAMRMHKRKFTENGRDREEEKRRRIAFEEFRANQEAQWRRDDYLSVLDGPHLQALDNILREAEEPPNPTVCENEGCSQQSEGNKTHSANIPDAMIDPSLLEISTTIRPTEAEAILSPINANTQTFKATQENECFDLSKLSPSSRRRHKKRLHMRRKRAEATGGQMLTSVAKLKPGRKTGAKKAHLPTRLSKQVTYTEETQEVSHQDVSNIDEMATLQDIYVFKVEQDEDDLEIVKFMSNDFPDESTYGLETNKKSSGMTLPYKIKHHLLGNGVNASYLNASGLGLFHLSSMERLMNLKAAHMYEFGAETCCISLSTIKLLHAEVTLFLAKLMQRAIAIHQQQRRLKTRTKAWNLHADQIGGHTIEEAIDMMGIQLDRRGYFESMINDMFNPGEEAGLEARASDSEESSFTRESSVQSTGLFPSLSLSQEICTPFVWQGSSATSQKPFHRSSSQASEEYTDAESFDENIEVDELLDEEELDHRDMEMALDAESELWKKYTSNTNERSIVGPNSMVDLEPDGNRTARRRQASGVKSRAYIEDSD